MAGNMISDSTLNILSQKIREFYRAEGYTGEFGDTAKFSVDGDGNLVLNGPDYTYYMLFGRAPGRMPPIAPIAGWCKQYGISTNPWAVRANIGKYGANGNNFIDKHLLELENVIKSQLIDDIQDYLFS